MFKRELLKNEIVRKIDCPGTHDHEEVSLTDGSSKRSCIMIKKYMDLYAERIKLMQVYEDDIWVITFPKAGTTWMQCLTWLLTNNLDYETAYNVNINDRFPFLELNGVLNKFNDGDSVEVIENLPRPRHIKSHLPMFLLPDKLWTVKPKIIYVARNPKDVATSFFHHYRNIVGFDGKKEDFVNAFLYDQVIYAPFNQHVLDFWKIRNEPNVEFIFYEDMKHDMKSVVKVLMKFLDKNYTEEEIDKLCKHLSVDSMRSIPSCNNELLVKKCMELNGKKNGENNWNFIRKGEVGSYKSEEYSNDLLDHFEQYTNDRCLKDSGFEYKL